MVGVLELHSWDVPVADRFDWWCELAARDLVPTRITSDDSDFRASAMLLDLIQVRVSMLEFPTLRSVRSRRLIQRSDPELWELALVSGGSMRVEQDRSEAVLEAGDLVLYDTSRPFDSTAIATTGPARAVILHLPRRALPVPEQALRSLVARRIPSQTGPGALLGGFLRGLAAQAATFNTPQAGRLGSAAIDLAAAFLASLADAEGMLPPQTRPQALLHEIKTFAIRNLREPHLSPTVIAEAHHISVRYLHHLFQQDKQSVSAFIRKQRLERCRVDLTDPCLNDRSVADVGARWGFHDAAVFSRAYKKAYGAPPGEYRTRRLHQQMNGCSSRPI
jgi:AraC-like DNA-binding protein